jgi:Glycosyl hydrolase family 26
VSPNHRAPARLTRRRLLGLAAAGVPLAACAARQVASLGAVAPAPTDPAESAGPDAPDSPAPSRSAAPVLPAGRGGPVPFTAGRVQLGAYLDLDGMSLGRALALRRRQLGREERIVHLFYDWTDPLPGALPELPAHAVPMISWRGTRYAEITGGACDALVARAARRLARGGRPTLLRWAWEMNGDWYPWGAAGNGRDPAGFVAAWRRVHRIFAEQGASNVAWVWSPNWNSSPDAPWNAVPRFYPGDAYVDWVGVSGYNLHRETPQTLFSGVYGGYAARKPIIVTEVGAVDRGGRTKADWIELFADWVRAHPAVGAVTWFDTDTHPGYDERWRVDTDPQALAAYKAMARDGRFAG